MAKLLWVRFQDFHWNLLSIAGRLAKYAPRAALDNVTTACSVSTCCLLRMRLFCLLDDPIQVKSEKLEKEAKSWE